MPSNIVSPEKASDQKELQAVAVPQGETLVSVQAQLYLYDIRVNEFVLMREQVTADVIQTGKFLYGLVVREGNTPYISQPIEGTLFFIIHY